MKTTIKTIVIGILLLVMGIATGFVGISYPRLIENEPLKSPVNVTGVDGTTMTLADGRRVEVDFQMASDDTWESVIVKSRYLVDLEPESGGDVAIYGSAKKFVCGTPWAKPILIPLIAVDINRFHRKYLGSGTVIWWDQQEAEQGLTPNGP